MSKISFKQVYDNLNKLAISFNKFTFNEDFLNAFGGSKRRITGAVIRSENELFSRTTLHIKQVLTNTLHTSLDNEIDNLSKAKKSDRSHMFSVFTDMKTLVAYNLKTEETITVELRYLASATEFFLPLAKLEQPIIPEEFKTEYKVIQRVTKLYDIIHVDNPLISDSNLSTFMCRLIFCFYAEDLDLFEGDLFLSEILNSKEDGSDLASILCTFFTTLGLPYESRTDNCYSHLPYVNIDLFKDNPLSPNISGELRHHIINLAELDWRHINTRAFCNMFPLIMKIEDRLEFGKCIESEDSINRIINPMFVEEFRDDFNNIKKLNIDDDMAEVRLKSYDRLLSRLAKVRVVDIKCCSGILPIAYGALRQIEYDILSEIKFSYGSGYYIKGYKSLIDLNNFCGMQDDIIVHQMAKLSMWLTDLGINLKFREELELSYNLFPLPSLQNIVNDDSLAMASWSQFSNDKLDTYIVGNLMNEYIDDVYEWIERGAKEIKGSHMEFAFAATDKVCQGNAVNTVWTAALDEGVEIRFAYQSFDWDITRDAIVVGLSNDNSKDKFIFSQDTKHKVTSINAYLFESNSSVSVKAEKTPQFSLPALVEGCKNDSNYNIILTVDEKNKLISKYPEVKKYIKQYITSKNMYGNDIKYCVLMNDISQTKSRVGMHLILDLDISISDINQLINNPNYQDEPSLVIPKNIDINFKYIPVIVVGSDTISHASNYLLYNPERWMFALLSSRMHLEWVKNVGAQTDTLISYSHERCFNTFPVPELTDRQKLVLGKLANNIIRARAKSFKALEVMYQPETMHEELKQAHQELDDYIDNLYLRVTDRKRRITANLDRVSILFNMIGMHQEGKKLKVQEKFESVKQELIEIAQFLRG